MRPNVDIPWSVHGQIKEYAQAEEMTIEEAYIEALKEGLSVMPTSVQSDNQFLESSMGTHTIGPRTFPVSSEEARDINDICTFLPRPSLPLQSVTFKTRQQQTTANELAEGLARSSAILDHAYDDWFTFHQLGGSWVGTGMENFVHGLQTVEDRLAEADFETYKTGFAVYLLEYREREYMLLHLEIDAYSGEIESFMLGFLTDGHPVDGSLYRKLAAQFGVSNLHHAKDRDLEEFTLTPEEDIYVDVVERLVKEDQRNEEPWVSGLIIENPIQQHEGIREAVLSRADKEYRNRPEYRNPYEQLASYDHAYVRLKNHHPKSEDRDYLINGISAQKLTPVFERQDIWNISVSANW
jgi:hypothetical protein